MVAVREERLPDDLVGDVRAVGVGRVDVVDAQLDRGPQHLDRGRPVARRPEDAGAGELHRAVADPVEVEVPDPVGAGPGAGWLGGSHGISLRTRVNLFAHATCDRRSAQGPSLGSLVPGLEDAHRGRTASSRIGELARVTPLLKFPAEAGHREPRRWVGEEASPGHGDSRDRSTTEPICHGQA